MKGLLCLPGTLEERISGHLQNCLRKWVLKKPRLPHQVTWGNWRNPPPPPPRSAAHLCPHTMWPGGISKQFPRHQEPSRQSNWEQSGRVDMSLPNPKSCIKMEGAGCNIKMGELSRLSFYMWRLLKAVSLCGSWLAWPCLSQKPHMTCSWWQMCMSNYWRQQSVRARATAENLK